MKGNRDQWAGRAKKAAGRLQEAVGRALENDRQRQKGIGKQVSGAAQARFGDLKKMVKKRAEYSPKDISGD